MKKLHMPQEYKYNMYLQSQKGTRWATEGEMKASLTMLHLEDGEYAAAGVPLISDGKTAYVDDKDTHTLILGSTGSKKSRLFVMPMINILAGAGKSFIVTDPKGELYDRTSGLVGKKGYKTILLNFREPRFGDSWNPLELPYKLYKSGDIDKAIEIMNDFSHALINRHGGKSIDPFWDNSAEALIFGLLLILFQFGGETEVNLSSLARMAALYNGNSNFYEEFLKEISTSKLTEMNMEPLIYAAERTRDSIQVELYSKLKKFISNSQLIDMMSDSSFDISRIGYEKTAVYIVMPDEKTTFHILVSTFLKQCYEVLIGEAQKQAGKQLPVCVHFILDEFANIPELPDMPSMITAARSRNIRFTLIVQSAYQLKHIYQDSAQTIKGNCDNWIFLTSRELELLQELSELIGLVDEEKDKPLISVSQLQRLSKEKGEALVLHGREYPFISRLADIDEYIFEVHEPIRMEARGAHDKNIFDIVEFYKDKTRADGDDISEELQKKFDELFNID